jgi:pimeloyl-ACP methyl ester carboxylesterase
MFEGFTRTEIETSGARIHLRHGGDGPPLLLLLVAGHDRGARTTARMCLDHPDRVKRAALIDILPNHHTHTSKEWALRSWH